MSTEQILHMKVANWPRRMQPCVHSWFVGTSTYKEVWLLVLLGTGDVGQTIGMDIKAVRLPHLANLHGRAVKVVQLLERKIWVKQNEIGYSAHEYRIGETLGAPYKLQFYPTQVARPVGSSIISARKYRI